MSPEALLFDPTTGSYVHFLNNDRPVNGLWNRRDSSSLREPAEQQASEAKLASGAKR